MAKYIDPPSGWKYGFPKELPNHVTDINKWLVENGYPQREIDRLGEFFHVGYSERPNDPPATTQNLDYLKIQEVKDVVAPKQTDPIDVCPFESMETETINFLFLCIERMFSKLTVKDKVVHDYSMMFDTYNRLIGHLFADKDRMRYKGVIDMSMTYGEMVKAICISVVQRRTSKKSKHK
jgi:hypothetical protein